MNRRRFFLLTAFVATGTAGRWLFLDSSPPGSSPLRPVFLARLFPDVDLVRLGRLYRAGYPAENSVHALVSQLLDSREVASLTPENPAILRHMAERVTADFRAGRTVLLDGWVLSLTEARQCALCSMLAA